MIKNVPCIFSAQAFHDLALEPEPKKLHLIIEKKFCFYAASYFDPINMTKNWLEYDRKIITPTNMNDGT